MTEHIAGSLFRITIPLPGNPLKELNAYLVQGTRNLLIDNGFNQPPCRETLLGALQELDVRLADTDCFITHLHADHCGLTPDLITTPGQRAFASAADAEHINGTTRGMAYWSPVLHGMRTHGFTDAQLDAVAACHPAILYAPSRALAFDIVGEGDVLTYGEHALRVLETPGHTPGQLCLYDAERRMLLSSDHILGDITPNIAAWPDMPDALGSYLKSLDTIAALPVNLTLPGHRSLIHDTRGRIAALKAHHSARLDEVRDILRQGPLSAYAVASRMTWSIRCRSWEDFPVAQQWFACGEALAHLEHLAARHELSRRTRDGLVVYGL